MSDEQPADERNIKLDAAYLASVGLRGLPTDEANVLLRYVYETLETRVGHALAQRMTNKQLDEFEMFFNAKDDRGAFGWLESNFPDYREIVQAEFETITAELHKSAPLMLSLIGRSDD
jgi:hypothetical protein